tara:strand:- start:1785 stop:1934 length:150 start_codon:yes stop_codon:yes gene_type:complete
MKLSKAKLKQLIEEDLAGMEKIASLPAKEKKKISKKTTKKSVKPGKKTK